MKGGHETLEGLFKDLLGSQIQRSVCLQKTFRKIHQILEQRNTYTNMTFMEESSEEKTSLASSPHNSSITLWAGVAASGIGNISLVEGRRELIKYQQT